MKIFLDLLKIIFLIFRESPAESRASNRHRTLFDTRSTVEPRGDRSAGRLSPRHQKTPSCSSLPFIILYLELYDTPELYIYIYTLIKSCRSTKFKKENNLVLNRIYSLWAPGFGICDILGIVGMGFTNRQGSKKPTVDPDLARSIGRCLVIFGSSSSTFHGFELNVFKGFSLCESPRNGRYNMVEPQFLMFPRDFFHLFPFHQRICFPCFGSRWCRESPFGHPDRLWSVSTLLRCSRLGRVARTARSPDWAQSLGWG